MKKLIVLIIIVAVLVTAYVYAKPFLIQPDSVKEVSIEELTAENDRMDDPTRDMQADSNVPPTFTASAIDFSHQYDKAVLAFAGGSLIDVNGDGTEEVFIGGGQGQDDALFYYENGSFVNRVADTVLSRTEATYGSMSIDMDENGDTDLLVARESGVYMYLNTGGTFTEEKIDIPFAPNTIPLSITASDINHDGAVDLYVSTFVDAANFASATFNNPEHGKPNVLLMNNGDNTFTDISASSGLDLHQNTFVSVFTDLDNDGWQDLVAATNTDTVRVYENNGDGTFTEHPVPGDYGFWMGLAVGDVDNDGDQDVFLSNIGNTIPVNLARGDLRDEQVLNPEMLLLRNDGDFTFTDVTVPMKLAGFEFSWGAVFEDFNLDGRLDLSLMQSYIKWAAHKLNKLPGRFFLQTQDGKFTPITTAAGVENSYYGMAPLASDFDHDGYPDLVFINLDGPARAFMNNGGDNHFISVMLPDTSGSLGARVTVTTSSGKELTKEYMTGVGLCSDQTRALTFGLGGSERPVSVTVEFPDGSSVTRDSVSVDTTLPISHSAVPPEVDDDADAA